MVNFGMVLSRLFYIYSFFIILQFSYPKIIFSAEKKDKSKDIPTSIINYENLKNDGEWPRPNFYGPLSPDLKDYKTSTDSFLDNYPSSLLFPFYFDLQKNINGVFASIGCSDYSIEKSFEYSRYLFRLITISYLFENLRELRSTALGLGGFAFVCPMGMNLFSDCKPTDPEMKKFLSRMENRIEEWSFVTNKIIDNNEVGKFIEEINNNEDPLKAKKIATFRIKEFCQKNKNCPKNIQEILKSIGQICRNDINLMKNICSEKDSLMGMSKIPLASKLILESNTVSVINLVESGEDCLHRFTDELRTKEHYPQFLSTLFPLIYDKILADKSRRYKQGVLFLPGALKEFDDRGLNDFLFVKPTPAAVAQAPTPVPTPLPKPTPVVVIAKAVVPAPTPVVILPTPTPTPTPIQITHTQFFLSSQKLKENDSEMVTVDMEKFKHDVGIPSEQVKDYKAIFEHYSKRESLLEMKNFDKLGSEHEPFRLIFLKYLLDNKIHQGLFNVQSVLSEKFYVINDIDQTKEPEYIQLKSGAKNSVGWEIIILKSPPKKEAAKAPSSSKIKLPKK